MYLGIQIMAYVFREESVEIDQPFKWILVP